MMGKLVRSVLITGFPERQPAVHLVRELALHGDAAVRHLRALRLHPLRCPDRVRQVGLEPATNPLPANPLPGQR